MKHATIDTDRFRSAVSAMPRDALEGLRQRASENFLKTGFPTTRQENWKYTSLAPASELGNAWLEEIIARNATALQSDSHELAEELRAAIDAEWIVVRNGVCDVAALEPVNRIPGVSVSLLSASPGNMPTKFSNALSAFNAALLTDGLHIKSEARASGGKPIGLMYIDGGVAKASQARTIIECAEDASLSVIACEISDAGAHFSNRVTQLSLAAGAALDYIRLQREGARHIATNRTEVRLSREASLQHTSFDFGGALTRNDIDINLDAEAARADVSGIYLAAGEQHMDNHIQVTHATGPAESSQHFRGILNDRARCVFNGKALVLSGADGTDARQANHNLLLSRRAEIDTKPELEIYADDVKCSHGATVGQLDETALFYLRSRGIDREHARQMLTRAFVSEIIEAINIAACKAVLADLVERRLNEILDDQDDE